MAPEPNLTIPLKLEAFVFNEKACDGSPKDAKIAPITQPNYTFLQLKDGLIQHDILNHVDLHNAIPKQANSRLYDLGTGELHQKRIGVYLHWVLPRFYRMGTASTPSAAETHTEHRRKKGLGASAVANSDYSAPAFPALPNRWLVIRKIDPMAETTVPRGAPIKPVEAWVIVSDRLQSIDDEALDNADLQVDISPYIKSNSKNIGNIVLEEQAEAFIGSKENPNSWREDDEKSKDHVDLTAVSSSNQLFVDYQPHCSNVFSTVDNFEYHVDGESEAKYLDSASASYYVLGWHSDETRDPFGSLDQGQTRQSRLDTLPMEFNGDVPLPDEVRNWLQSDKPGHVLCHGAMYNVLWNRSELPKKVPANDASHRLLESMPVAVGTTPIDSLLAYIETHHQSDLENDLRIIGPLLRAQDQGVDAYRVASDEVQNWNFARESGGQHWYLQSPKGQEAQKPTDKEAGGLEQLNQRQRILDSTTRQLVQLRWDLFSYWWRYVSASVEDRPGLNFPVQDLANRIQALEGLSKDQQSKVNDLVNDASVFPVAPQSGVLPEFNQPRDPTLLVGGIQAGWPDDYLKSLKVRLDTQLVFSKTPVDVTPYKIEALPPSLQETAKALVQEFVLLGAGQGTLPSGHYFPLYHDHGDHGAETDPLRDQWGDTQPWAPLFLEWEAEYFHIPWEDSEVGKFWDLFGKDLDGNGNKQWRLGIAPEVDLSKYKVDDTRTLSGRILLLPQPNFSLQAAIDQLFNSVDPDILKKYLNDEQQKAVKNNTYSLPFLSAPLDGFTDHLLTLNQGTHIKPLARYPGREGLEPIADAKVGPFSQEFLSRIQIHSEKTPYGSTIAFSSLAPEDDDAKGTAEDKLKPNPFKPATHGQFRFLKLNIVDKFGQAISGIDPRYGHEHDEAVYPQLSEYFAPQELNGKPNVVRPPGPGQDGHCEFVQVPPAINQPARLNAAFMVHDERYDKPDGPQNYSYWRPVTEWENPIWGWIVLNYVDYGIQVFLPDGTFYREIRLASPTSQPHTSSGAKWLPFGPPKTRPNTQQLDHLIDKLAEQDQKYLLAFLAMANQSLDAATSVPSAYATFLNSLVGRPLALVNAGWSLELSTDAKQPQFRPGPDVERNPRMDLLGTGERVYEFPVKLGDKDRASDGLVGYFNTTRREPGNELELSEIFTYFTANDSSGTLKEIKANLPHFRSFWLEPDGYIEENPAPQFTQDWNRKFRVFGTIVDPFLPITAYSSILPMTNLALPPWTWQQAMQKMTAFFHLGPIVVADDVQLYYDKGTPLSEDYKLTPPSADQTVPGSAVGIPSLQTGSWAWLQPFIDRSDQEVYKALGLGKVDSRPKYQQGPYTAIEGYLQLKEPIVRPDVENKKTRGD